MKDRLNVAVIGAGLHGIVHIRSYLQYPRANLVTICETNPERARKIEEDWGVATCTDYKDLVSDDSIEAVSVVTPDFLHRDMVIQLVEAGKHVLVEKPLATTEKDAREIVLAVEKAGRELMIDYQYRFNRVPTPITYQNAGAYLFTIAYEMTGREEYRRMVNQLVKTGLAVESVSLAEEIGEQEPDHLERLPYRGVHLNMHPTLGMPTGQARTSWSTSSAARSARDSPPSTAVR